MEEPNFALAGTSRLYTRNDETQPLLGQQLVLIPDPTDSPRDPLNWSTWRKYWHSALVLFITAFTAAITNDAGAAGASIQGELYITYDVQNTAAGVLFLVIGYWCLLASPMPRLYGRRIQYLICLLAGLGGSIWFGRIQTQQDVIWNQFFVGASQSCSEALAQLSLSDLFFQHQRGTVLGIYILATSVGTFLGPLVAGYIAFGEPGRWRWIGWSGAIGCAVTFVVFFFGLEETSFERELYVNQRGGDGTSRDEVIGEKKLDSEALQEIDPIHAAPVPAPASTDKPKSYWQRMALITPVYDLEGLGVKQYGRQLFHTLRIFTFPAVIFSGLQWGAQDAWLSFYLTAQEDYWTGDPWGYNDQQVAVMNVPTLIGAIIGCGFAAYSDYFVLWMAKRRDGISEAEDRLWLLLASAAINPAGLFVFGIGSGMGWDWPAPYVGLGMIGFGWGCAGDLAMAYLMDAYPDMVLEGMVGVAVINNTLAAIFTFTASKWITASGLSNTFIACGVLSLVFHLTTLPMLYWGKTFRKWTASNYRKYLYIRDGK